MIPISIDISDTVEEFYLSKDETDSLRRYILDRVYEEYRFKWDEEVVNSDLKSTRKEYLNAMFTERPDDFTFITGLSARYSPKALMVEDGADSFDMKVGFSQSDKRKDVTRKDGSKGWYITIPFHLATSEALRESETFSGKMPKAIYNLAKKLGDKESIKLDNIPSALQGLGKNAVSGYQHQSNIYEGLQRIEGGSGPNEKRGGYFTFRRVSDLSNPAAWIHPGIEARDLMGKALEKTDIDAVADKAIDEFLESR
jgi:hypothetical protein